MNKENGESGDNAQLVLLATWRTSLGRVFEFYLDRAAPHTIRRWRVTLVLAMIYVLRVYWAKGFHVISYGLATYVLNLFIGFLSPKINPELEGLDGVSFTGKCSDEHRPFQRRLPECRFWAGFDTETNARWTTDDIAVFFFTCFVCAWFFMYFVTKAIIVSLLLTFISVLDVPVYWHIYLCYWIFLFVVTMKRQIVHMIRYKYNPFTLACQDSCWEKAAYIYISPDHIEVEPTLWWRIKCVICSLFINAKVLFHLLTNNQEVGSKTMENLYPSVMDRLFQIAQIGDVEKLQQLLEEKPLILHQAPLICAENPLHFSSAAGHLDFTREMVKLKPEFARGLNPEGYSCLHLASANGHVQIVREIISVDPVLCRVKGRGGKTPFHVAVLTGRVDLIKEMLSSCEGCIEDVTVQKETAFHLAVRNYQFESLQVMLDWIRQMKKEDILNKKDEHGNTILHLAVWKKQRQALELLLSNSAGTLEVNAINKSGLTALDLLLIFPSEAGDREIEEIIKGAGALRAQDIALHITTHSSSARGSLASQGVCNLVEYFSFHAGRDSPGEVRGTLLVLAVLVATATYQVGINPPGGVWQDDSQGQVAGTSIMGFHNMVSYVLLVAFNSIGFSMSLYMIGTLTGKFPLQTELQICLFALYCTYNLSVTVLSPKSAQLFTIVFISVLPTAVPIFCSLLRKYRFGGLARIFRRGN